MNADIGTDIGRKECDVCVNSAKKSKHFFTDNKKTLSLLENWLLQYARADLDDMPRWYL